MCGQLAWPKLKMVWENEMADREYTSRLSHRFSILPNNTLDTIAHKSRLTLVLSTVSVRYLTLAQEQPLSLVRMVIFFFLLVYHIESVQHLLNLNWCYSFCTCIKSTLCYFFEISFCLLCLVGGMFFFPFSSTYARVCTWKELFAYRDIVIVLVSVLMENDKQRAIFWER